MEKQISISMFSKPWKEQSLEELAELTLKFGFTGIEFPLRDGYQAEPATAERTLPEASRVLGGYGVKITSVASVTDEHIFSACAMAGVPVIRIMFGNKLEKDYLEAEADMKRQIEKFLPFCEKYKIKVGIQQHCGPGINNSMEMLSLLREYDSNLVGGIWDAAHSGLAGEEPEQALDIIKSHLVLVNFKNAFYKRVNGPEAYEAKYAHHYTTGRQGLCSWPRAIKHLKKIGFYGNVCLTAEYSDHDNIDKYVMEDCEYIKLLINDVYGEEF